MLERQCMSRCKEYPLFWLCRTNTEPLHVRIIDRHQPIVTVEENMTNESLAKDFILLRRDGASHKNPSPEQMQ
jgi:hypothetical protein